MRLAFVYAIFLIESSGNPCVGWHDNPKIVGPHGTSVELLADYGVEPDELICSNERSREEVILLP